MSVLVKTHGFATGSYQYKVAFAINKNDGRLPTILNRNRFGYPDYGSGPLLSETQSVSGSESTVVVGGLVCPVVSGFFETDWPPNPSTPLQATAMEQGGWLRTGSRINRGWNGWNVQWQRYIYTDRYNTPHYDYATSGASANWDGKSDLPIPARYSDRSATQIGWFTPLDIHLAYGQAPDTIVSLINYEQFVNETGDTEAAKLFLPIGLRSALATAYSEAIKSLPSATTNSFANVLSTLDTVKGLVSTIFHPISSFGEFGRSLSKMKDDVNFIKQLENFWLQYRYVFNTTKADVEEYRDVTRALSTLVAGDVIHADGDSSFGGCIIKASISVKTNTIMPKTSLEWLQYYGFNISLVNAWDMVPFSFVVDWFTHLGDILDWIENQNNYLQVVPDQVWFTARGSSSGYSGYIRVPGYIPRELVFLDLGNTSAKTIFKRIIDGICLFGP